MQPIRHATRLEDHAYQILLQSPSKTNLIELSPNEEDDEASWLREHRNQGARSFVGSLPQQYRGHAIERDEIYAKGTKLEHYAAAGLVLRSVTTVPPSDEADPSDQI